MTRCIGIGRRWRAGASGNDAATRAECRRERHAHPKLAEVPRPCLTIHSTPARRGERSGANSSAVSHDAACQAARHQPRTSITSGAAGQVALPLLRPTARRFASRITTPRRRGWIIQTVLPAPNPSARRAATFLGGLWRPTTHGGPNPTAIAATRGGRNLYNLWGRNRWGGFREHPRIEYRGGCRFRGR